MPTMERTLGMFELIDRIKNNQWKREKEQQELENETLKNTFAKQVLSQGEYAQYLLTGKVPETVNWESSAGISPEVMKPLERFDISSIAPQLGQRPEVGGLKNFQLKGGVSIPGLSPTRPPVGYEQIMAGAGEEQSKRIQQALEYYGKSGITKESDLNEIAQRIAGMRGNIPVEGKPKPENLTLDERIFNDWRKRNPDKPWSDFYQLKGEPKPGTDQHYLWQIAQGLKTINDFPVEVQTRLKKYIEPTQKGGGSNINELLKGQQLTPAEDTLLKSLFK